MEEIWGGWAGFIMLTGGALVVLTGTFVLIWQLIKSWQAWLISRTENARSTEYSQLAERAVTVQETLAEDQMRIARELSQMRASVANMERLLSEVE